MAQFDPDILPALLDRLRDQSLCPSLVTVDEAWFMEPMDRLEEETPAAFAYLAEDGAAGEVQTTRPRQAITMNYGVWLVCTRDQFRPLRGEIRAALFGHCFSERHEPMAYRGGKADIRGAYIWWREFWTTDTTLFKQ